MRYKRTLSLFLIFLAADLSSQTLRPNHWLMEEVQHFQNRGQLWTLSSLSGPITVQQLQDSLQNIESETAPSMVLMRKFSASQKSGVPFIWMQLDNSLQRENERNYVHTIQRAGVGLRLNPLIQVFGSFNIDNQLDADSSYIGERQSGFTAFMEQAYIRGEWNSFTATFGRDYLVWGPGLDASLHLSDFSRPLDHLFLSWKNRYIQLSYFTATLDRTEYLIDGAEAEQNRYLSGHRIEVRPWKFVRIGLAETALFGGPDAGLDFAFVNPVLFYTGVEQNGPQSANVMACLDATILLKKSFSLYGSLLVDDFQFENKSVDDKGEPAEVGYMTGMNWADPFGVVGLDFFSEYTRVTNRTYNGQGGPWEKYLHRNRPLGHFLGNDFDRLILGVRYRSSAKLWMKAHYEHRRRGEGRVDKPFDMPWRDVAVGESYSEPFPTGVVEFSDIFSATCHWRPFFWLRTDVHVSHYSIENFENKINVKDNFWDARLTVSFELFHSFTQ